MTDQKELYASLMASAVAARDFSYSPYSGYRVGAALLGKSGKIYFRGPLLYNVPSFRKFIVLL